jgi:N-acyl-D-amino-acid deacylase
MTRTLLLSALLIAAPLAAQAPTSFLVTNALLIDGSGKPAVKGMLRVKDGRITAMGASLKPTAGEKVIDAKGQALAPGFIDTHSHADGDLDKIPDALGAVSQGITTIVGGQDGGSYFPLKKYFAKLAANPVAVNVASYSGHNTLRDSILGTRFEREATPEEIRRMQALLQEDMDAGALGLSTGLEYDPGIYSARSEVLELAKTAAASKGRYISHIRSEDRYFWAAIDEILTIGRVTKMPVQVSHVKLAMTNLWGKADSLVGLLDAARAGGVKVSADIYPYPYWHSTLKVLFPRRNYEDRAEAEIAVTQVSTPEGLRLGRFAPDTTLAGLTLKQISEKWGKDSVTTLIELIRMIDTYQAAGGDGGESVIGTSMTEPDIERLMRWPETNFCTDGELDGRHPRGFGTYPRILGRYVRERKVLSLEEAVHRASALAADHMGFTDRGRLAPGQAADLVLFDPATVIDRATPDDPQLISTGITTVWVNGVAVFADGRTTGAHPGVVLRRR